MEGYLEFKEASKVMVSRVALCIHTQCSDLSDELMISNQYVCLSEVQDKQKSID